MKSNLDNLEITVGAHILVETAFSTTVECPDLYIEESKINKKIFIHDKGYILTPGSTVHICINESHIDLDYVMDVRLNKYLEMNNISKMSFYSNVVSLRNNSNHHSIRIKSGMKLGDLVL